MSKVKKIILTAILTLAALFISSMPSKVFGVGFVNNPSWLGLYAHGSDSVWITYQNYLAADNMYCVQHGQRMTSGGMGYKTVAVLKIDGKTMTGNYAYNGTTPSITPFSSNDVAILGYICRLGGNQAQQAIWSFFPGWYNANRYRIGMGRNTDFALNGGTPDQATANRVLAAARAYANSLSDSGTSANAGITDNTNVESVKNNIEPYEIGDSKYVKIGPFNWTYGGTLTNITVEDQNGSAISNVLFATYNGTTLQQVSISGIKSGKDFYVLVPSTVGVSEISRITGRTEVTRSVVTLILMDSLNSGAHMQNMIVSFPETDTDTVDTPFDYHIPLIGNIRIIKVNKYNHEFPLEGVGFYIQNTDTGKWVKQDGDSISYVDSRDQATEFVTDANGEIEVDDLIVGNYEAFESKNPNYGYEMPTDGMPLEIEAGTTTDNVLENRQIYVKLSGYVWIDIPSGKQTVDDELYTQNIDYRVDGIPVRLVDSSGNVVTKEDGTPFETTTTEITDEILKDPDPTRGDDRTVGAFLFEDVPLKDDADNPLGDYHIEFDYNGLVYTNVTPMIDGDPKSGYSSKAAEFQNTTGNIEGRYNFNVKLNRVESDGPGSTTGTAGGTKFTYEKGEGDNSYKQFVLTPDYAVDGQSGLSPTAHYEPRTNTIDGQKQAIAYDYDGDGNRIEGIREETKITASTDAAGYYLNDVFTWGDEIVRHNNLGLYKREQPDMSLIKDINSVAVTYRGYNHIYQYAKRFEHPQGQEPEGYEVGVKYGSEYGTTQFSQPIYEADYEEAIKEGEPDQMCAYITYAIGLRNQSTDLTVQINSIIDYFDEAYSDAEIVVGDQLDDKSIAIDAGWEPTTGEAEGGYRKLTIPCNIQIEPQQETKIYVQFKLNAEQVKQIIEKGDDGSVESDLLYNVAEIGSYSTLQNGVDYAGIDVDSNPGNAIVNGDVDENNRPMSNNDYYYEDDTDIAPGFRLKKAEPRVANGVAFVEDIVSPADGVDTTGLMTGYERRGNGHLEDSEEKLPGVKVELIEANDDGTLVKDENGNDKIAQLLNPDTDQWEDATATTDDNGLYSFTGYVPGKYIIKFTWGDTEHKVQYYKSTAYIYTSQYDNTRYNANYSGDRKYYWYQQAEENDRYSDAIDDGAQRAVIDKQMLHLTYDQQTAIDNYTVGNGETITVGGNTEVIIDKMDSYTLLMDMGIEHKDQQEYNSVTSNEVSDNEEDKAGLYKAFNIDFGIVERPKQALELDKRVAGMKVTLANGQVLVDVTVDENGNLDGSSANLIYLAPGQLPYQGLLRLELDNELIQGALVEVTYEITATNISETDYVFAADGGVTGNEHYYFGVETGDLVTLNPTTVIDYLDSDWAYESDRNKGWTILTTDSLDDFFAANTGTEGSIHGIDGSVSGLGNDSTNGTSGTINRYTVLYSTEFNADLVPGKNTGKIDSENGSVSHQLYANKTLTTTDEIELDNQVEVVEVNKPGGSGLDETPGNSDPSGDFTSDTKEPDNDKAETVIVTPNTGANLNFILPISVAAVALIILGTGVVLIRKKVLRS